MAIQKVRQHTINFRTVSNGVDLTPDWKSERELVEVNCCLGCMGFGKYFHEPDPPEVIIRFREYDYTAPFFCFCCGIQICARQFAYGRNCGYCDTGQCERDRMAPAPEAAAE